jgi:methionyl-tRNA synthetase
MDKLYITTAIDYINAKPHIGHAYEKVAADVLARFYAGKIGKDRVRFLTGTDEHGSKIEKAASTVGEDLQKFADETAAKFSFAWDQLNIEPDRFIRTTDPDHVKAVEDMLMMIKKHGHVYEGEYKGWYCTSCETFYTETDVPDHICPIHKNPLELLTEKNWFLRISNFTQVIEEKIKNDEIKIWPLERKNEILSLLEQGFNDIAISRPNVAWGIPLPWDKSQTVYVWVDALINYVTGARADGQDWWPADWHIVGKDISKFHCIIWPAILLAAGLDTPKGIIVHGYLTVGGEKMSKTTGNVIDPNDWVAKYGADAVRYLLMREVAFGQDGDVSEEKLKIRYEGDLANGLGNLVSRITTLIEKNLDGEIGKEVVLPEQSEIGEIELDISNFRFHEALAKIWGLVALGNKIVDEKKLWELAKSEAAVDKESFRLFCWSVLVNLLLVGKLLLPFMPSKAQKVIDIVTAKKITKAEPLFPRIT